MQRAHLGLRLNQTKTREKQKLLKAKQNDIRYNPIAAERRPALSGAHDNPWQCRVFVYDGGDTEACVGAGSPPCSAPMDALGTKPIRSIGAKVALVEEQIPESMSHSWIRRFQAVSGSIRGTGRAPLYTRLA